MSEKKPISIYLAFDWAREQIFGPAEQADIAELTNVKGSFTKDSIQDHMDDLSDVEVIFGGWGIPPIDEAFLKAVPNLKIIFYGAGSIRGFATDAFWDRGIRVTTAAEANARPVAEYCLAATLFSLKGAWRIAYMGKQTGKAPENTVRIPGCYKSKVGVITIGAISRKYIELMKPYDLDIYAYSRSLNDEKAAAMGIQYAQIDEIFRTCDVVSLHTPLVDATKGMITGELLDSMKEGATFINTARGAVVREDEMIEVLQRRPDIQAVLDVTAPEPPAAGSPLYTLPNVFYTPHIAGSLGEECNRMGRAMVDELQQYIEGKPLAWEVSRDEAAKMA